MNIQEYISSGIVESYVLGIADVAERAEFERMCAAHPEVLAAREAFEIALEEQTRSKTLRPSANIKSKIFSTIEMEGTADKPAFSGGGSGTSPFSFERDSLQNDPEFSKAKVRTISNKNWQQYIAVAAVILLLCSTALNFYFFNRYKEYNERYQTLVASQSELASHNEVLQTRLLDYEKAVEMMKDPGMAIVKMPAQPSSPDPSSATTVYWDTVTRDVYLAINKLPAPSDDQQYQLWAMVDGKPVDAGVIEMKEGAGMIKMKNIPRAQAFAITLERKGGSPTPSLDKLYVMGKV